MPIYIYEIAGIRVGSLGQLLASLLIMITFDRFSFVIWFLRHCFDETVRVIAHNEKTAHNQKEKQDFGIRTGFLLFVCII